MTRILEDLFFGNINPNDKEFIQDSRYGEAARMVAETEEKLLNLLNGEAKQFFEAHVSAQGDLVLYTALEHFISGFRIGARMAAEVCGDVGGDLRDIEKAILRSFPSNPKDGNTHL